ncbi:MAG: hypothetical protein WCJ30_13425, partial [Deltaproteobacteria bacterium]
MRALALCLIVAVPTCKPSRPEPTSGAVRRYGDVMSEVGRRFERSGRAAVAQSWELAAYDVGEIAEAFESDVPAATPPPEVHIDLRPTAAAFLAAHPGALRRAIEAHDRAAFDAAFASAAAACNGCH